MRHFIKRRWLVVLVGTATVLGVVLGTLWRSAIKRDRSVPDEPFQIAGNLYYVGSTGITAFLLTGPQGQVLIDGGYPETAPLIAGSIAALGFKITDVKALLNTHAHSDHAGGLAALQQASGAELWVSDGDYDDMAAGGRGDIGLGLVGVVLFSTGELTFAAPRSTTGSKTVIRSVSARSRSPRMSPLATRAAAPRGRFR